MLDPGIDEALHRARLDQRSRRTYAAIRHWYRTASRPQPDVAEPLATSRHW